MDPKAAVAEVRAYLEAAQDATDKNEEIGELTGAIETLLSLVTWAARGGTMQGVDPAAVQDLRILLP
jgi:hypothetical protein